MHCAIMTWVDGTGNTLRASFTNNDMNAMDDELGKKVLLEKSKPVPGVGFKVYIGTVTEIYAPTLSIRKGPNLLLETVIVKDSTVEI